MVSQTIPEVLWVHRKNYHPKSEAKAQHGGWLIIFKKGLVNSNMNIYRQQGSGFNQAWNKAWHYGINPGLRVNILLKVIWSTLILGQLSRGSQFPHL